LYKELCRSKLDYAFPDGAYKCRLNVNLLCMGLEPLDFQSCLNLRSICHDLTQMTSLTVFGVAPVLVTAPHNVVLIRENRPPLKMQENTTTIAEELANCLSGSSLAWCRREQYHGELQWAMVKQRKQDKACGNTCRILSSSHRDPSYLRGQEISSNEWFSQMCLVRQRFKNREKGSLQPMALHIDVQGCQNPPAQPAHLIIGLGAMLQGHGGSGKRRDAEQLERIGEALTKSLEPVIEKLQLMAEGEKAVLVLLRPDETNGKNADLCGVWPNGTGRCTMTQMALAHANFLQVCQLQMSLALRKSLSSGKSRGLGVLKQLAQTLFDVLERV